MQVLMPSSAATKNASPTFGFVMEATIVATKVTKMPPFASLKPRRPPDSFTLIAMTDTGNFSSAQ